MLNGLWHLDNDRKFEPENVGDPSLTAIVVVTDLNAQFSLAAADSDLKQMTSFFPREFGPLKLENQH